MTHTFELNNAMLEPVLANLFGHSLPQVQSFEMKALKPGIGNPTSLGVYRVGGTVMIGDQLQPFSLVVKHLAQGNAFMDASDPRHWNYYRREIVFFESKIASRIPASIGYPKYLGQTEIEDGTYLFWNEDLGDLTKSQFTWQSCLTAARLVAELNSIDISDSAEYPWLSVGTPTGWLAFKEQFFAPFYSALLEIAATDQTRALGFDLYGAYLPQQERFVELMGNARQTFVHGDFNLNNLVMVANREYELIALDWQLCGVAAIGSEVAPIFGTAIELGVIEGTREQFDELCEAYTKRFNQLNSNSPVELSDVQRMAAIMGFTIVAAMASFFVWPDLDPTKPLPRKNAEDMMDSFTNGLLSTYAKVMTELL